MFQSKKVALPGVILTALLALTSCPANIDTITVTGQFLTGKDAKTVYNAYISTAPATLGSITSQSATDVMHIANFSDTLLMNDQNGILRKSLASEAIRNDDNTEFKFKVRDDVYWRTYTGEVYTARDATGEYTEQKVTEEDFVTAARQILTFTNNSEIYYMYTLFIDNAWEYYLYTMMANYISTNAQVDGVDYSLLKGDNEAQAQQLMVLIEDYSGEPVTDTITGSDIQAISNFERVGVYVDDDGYLTYRLDHSASYFPTVLTYTPYMPVNNAFYREHRSTYGSNNSSILYIGPYFLTEYSATSLTYKKNPYYHDADQVHVETINYTVMGNENLNYADMREDFESGIVDGFTLNAQDAAGWEKYITGEDGSGTLQDPYDGSVNSRELDTVDYTYHYVLNINRPLDNLNDNGSNVDTFLDNKLTTEQREAIITNTNAAMKIEEVRKALLGSIDVSLYNTRNDLTEEGQHNDQYQMNTFTPRGFVQDENGKDYVEYYYEEYAEQKGITVEEAKAAIGPQQVSNVTTTNSGSEIGVNYVDGSSELNELMNDARSALDQAEDQNLLTLPITVSYMSASNLNSESVEDDNVVIRSMNQRLNGCRIGAAGDQSLPMCEVGASGQPEYPYFYVQANSPTNLNNYTIATESGYYTIMTGWGWIGDYADPLTYMHVYMTNGEMSEMCGNTDYNLPNYRLDDNGTLYLETEQMFAEYNAMVNAADDITESNVLRYEAFAEAEYYLINELHIMKPSYMTSQGWSASVSRSAGYEMPTAPYGLASQIMKGMWVLVEPPTAEERRQCRELQEQIEEEALEAVGRDTIGPAFDDFVA